MGFVDFSLRTEFSIGHAFGSVSKYISAARRLGLSHLAVNDYASAGAWVKHYFDCIKADIIPIIGMTVFISHYRSETIDGEVFFRDLSTDCLIPFSEANETIRDLSTIHHEVCLYAVNSEGFYNLIKLHNKMQLNGDSFPSIAYSELFDYCSGLVCVLPIEFSEIGDAIYNGLSPRSQIMRFKGGFKHLYFSTNISTVMDAKFLEKALSVSSEYSVPLIPVGNCRYPEKADKAAFNMLRRINRTRGVISFDYDDDSDMHLKDFDELRSEFLSNSGSVFNSSVFDSLVANLSELIDLFEVIELDVSPKMPKFPNAESLLREKAWAGLKLRGFDNDEAYCSRLEYELDNVIRAGFADYFLFLEDVVSWYIDEQKCLMSSGRGSGGGSLVLYCLRIINIDPVKYNLLFERFLDASRLDEIISKGLKPSANDLPDCDLDFSSRMKEPVKDYLVNKYGYNHVCSIGNVGYMRVKGLLKNVGRVLGISDSEMNHLTTVGLKELSADDEKLDIEELCLKFPDLRAMLNRYPELGDIFNRLYGSINALGKHAAGMIISDLDLIDNLPVRLDDGKLVSCWSEGIQGRELGMMGFVKMDFLNIETLDVIEEMISLVKDRHGVTYDFSNIPLDDRNALAQLNHHDNIGIFQFDTQLTHKVVDAMGGIFRFEDLAALSALLRPGALQNKFDVLFGDLRKDSSGVVIPDVLKPYFSETFGLPIFQEHAFFFARYFAKLSNVDSYNFMRTLYKAKMVGDAVDFWRKKVIEEPIASGVYDASYLPYAKSMFEQLLKFQDYSFNKSHALAYSVYSSVQLWFKQNYPLEFWCASLNAVDRSKEKKGVSLLDQRVRSCAKIGIKATAPCVNNSEANWRIEGNSLIGPLKNIKGFSDADVETIISGRPYSSLKDFLDKTKISRVKFESLLFAGAFNSFGSRNELYNWYEDVYLDKGASANQLSFFFDDIEEEKEKVSFSGAELDAKFFDLNGYQIMENITVVYSSYISKNNIGSISRALERIGGVIKVIGKIIDINNFVARSGTHWTKMVLSDGIDQIEFLGRTREVEYFGDKFTLGNVLVLSLSCTRNGHFLANYENYDVTLVN